MALRQHFRLGDQWPLGYWAFRDSARNLEKGIIEEIGPFRSRLCVRRSGYQRKQEQQAARRCTDSPHSHDMDLLRRNGGGPG